ncbi:bifunctional DNA-binding transcriptional regulator/antitoxin component of YhaV-PrlF toxin-antitoxin module [Duganella sp. 1411]|jgi:bifunctional DNA-binding transcriptional regulator/antitoxin component of YhaV-PrlF toxin-antitoxin module|uniref:AbrB/MazE/SpoVT family DNA-binding domain-containing protein n=1 Tax=Duganella sp. 1411 TaxID=2806572 RepID=UPI001AEA832B|nr:AbrB/MazE/SpoVT family DNA-binding domain-containing protein [Duganella sp. 1411]MBP1206358.1 bifunctional DNA-binding transcriptional regulator/antitoxin component of YhaV-PrlF toxin-antitoxin module [Duganella sp. 1411]
MSDVIADENGNVALPKDVLEQLNIKPGDLVRFTISTTGAAIIYPKNRSICDLGGMLYREGQKPLPIEKLSR